MGRTRRGGAGSCRGACDGRRGDAGGRGGGATTWPSESKGEWNRGRAWWQLRTRWRRRARCRRGRGGSDIGDASSDEGGGSNDTVGDERDWSQNPFAIALERGITGGARNRDGCPPLQEMATTLAGGGISRPASSFLR